MVCIYIYAALEKLKKNCLYDFSSASVPLCFIIIIFSVCTIHSSSNQELFRFLYAAVIPAGKDACHEKLNQDLEFGSRGPFETK